MSIAGGYHKAVESAARLGMETCQIFTRNNNQWRAKPIEEHEVERFRETLAETGIAHPIAHASYLINLASPDRELWQKSVDGLVVELERATRLGISCVVVHPGAYTDGTEAGGIRQVVRALNQVHRKTPSSSARCLLETTAGQGTSIGCRFEHLAAILERVREPDRLGTCFDTCHVFAAGYRLNPRNAYYATMRQFDHIVGLATVKAFHLNDSKRPCGSRVDRHEHIGRGHLGLEPFRYLLRDRRFRKTPMYLETPKGREAGEDLDVVNLNVLRSLLGRS
jgi:deoxyribonuclease-4